MRRGGGLPEKVWLTTTKRRLAHKMLGGGFFGRKIRLGVLEAVDIGRRRSRGFIGCEIEFGGGRACGHDDGGDGGLVCVRQ